MAKRLCTLALGRPLRPLSGLSESHSIGYKGTEDLKLVNALAKHSLVYAIGIAMNQVIEFRSCLDLLVFHPISTPHQVARSAHN